MLSVVISGEILFSMFAGMDYSDNPSLSSIIEQAKTFVVSVKINVISVISGEVLVQVLVSSITNSCSLAR